MFSRAIPIKSATKAICRFQLSQCTKSAFSTAVRRPLSPPRRNLTTTIRKVNVLPRNHLQKRFNSTEAPVVGGIHTAPSPSTSTSVEPLTWNRFLALRKTRRRISLVASILSAIGCTSVGIVVLSSQEVDSLGAQMLGLDPIIVLGLSTVACGLVGWLIGPFFGNAVFNLWYKNLRPQIATKEREFYARIKKFRVDPTSSSMQNPVPDYYGEKIGSVADYRRWLKDQRAFNLKRGKLDYGIATGSS